MSEVVGHGVDIIDLAEFETLLRNSGEILLARCFTEQELVRAGDGPNRIARLAARFAAKEAILKSMGQGWVSGISWKDIEVVNDAFGAPSVKVTSEVARIAEAKGIRQFHVSLSHTGRTAMASVIAVGDRD